MDLIGKVSRMKLREKRSNTAIAKPTWQSLA
jgi:hypothetical protein